MKKILVLLLFSCFSLTCMEKFNCFKGNDSQEKVDHKGIIREIQDWHARQADIAVRRAKKPWYRNGSGWYVFEGSLWIGGAFVFGSLLAILIFTNQIPVNASTVLGFAGVLGAGGWGGKQIKHGMYNQFARDNAILASGAYSSVLGAQAPPEEGPD